MNDNEKTVTTAKYNGRRRAARLASLVLALCLALCLGLAGCGGQDSGEESDEATYSAVDNSMYDFKGALGDFTTVDLDGKTVTESIFSQNKVTAIDIWGTYCGYCIEGFPDNEKLYQEYKDKGIGFVGLCIDCQNEDLSLDPEQVALAKDILKENGVTYPQILLSMDLAPVMEQVPAIPFVLFVDSEGTPIWQVYIGTRTYEEWKVTFDKLVEKYCQ